MSRNRIILTTLFLLLFSIESLYALGLGSINVSSHLQHPLQAEIPLISADKFAYHEVNVKFVSSDKVTDSFLQQYLKLRVIRNIYGKKVIHVTTSKPFGEPYVQFQLEISWPKGRMIREYTLLLDPPGFAPTLAQSHSPRKIQQRQANKQIANTIQPKANISPSSLKQRSNNVLYTKSSDTLWHIAKQVRPSSELSMNQTMIAIQQLNPDIFIANNINLLKKNQQIKKPTFEQIKMLSKQEATSHVAKQNQIWSEYFKGKRDLDAALAKYQNSIEQSEKKELATGEENNSNQEYVVVEAGQQTPKAELKLLATEEDLKAEVELAQQIMQEEGLVSAEKTDEKITIIDGAQIEEITDEPMTDFHTQYALNLEKLDKANKEINQLETKMNGMQTQLDEMQRLLTIKNEYFRQLQTSVVEQTKKRDQGINLFSNAHAATLEESSSNNKKPESVSIFDELWLSPAHVTSLLIAFLLLVIWVMYRNNRRAAEVS